MTRLRRRLPCQGATNVDDVVGDDVDPDPVSAFPRASCRPRVHETLGDRPKANATCFAVGNGEIFSTAEPLPSLTRWGLHGVHGVISRR
jgi:hypothetical protein